MAQYLSIPLKKGDMLRFYPDVAMDAMDCHRAVMGKDGRVFELFDRNDVNGKRGMYHGSFFKWVAALPGNVLADQILVNSVHPVPYDHAINYLIKEGKMKSESDVAQWEDWIQKVTNPEAYKAAKIAKKLEKENAKINRRAQMIEANEVKRQMNAAKAQQKAEEKLQKKAMIVQVKAAMKMAAHAQKEAKKVQRMMVKAAEKQAVIMRRRLEKEQKLIDAKVLKAHNKEIKAQAKVLAKALANEQKAQAKAQVKEQKAQVKAQAKALVKEQKAQAKAQAKAQEKALVKEQKAQAKEQKAQEKEKMEFMEEMKQMEQQMEQQMEHNFEPGQHVEVVVQWDCPNDGTCYPWCYKGIRYYRTYLNQVWECDQNNEVGLWKGVYIPKEDRIDTLAQEPDFDIDE